MTVHPTTLYEKLPEDIKDKIWTYVLDAYRNEHKMLLANSPHPYQLFDYYSPEIHDTIISSIYRTYSGMMLYRAIQKYYQDLCDRDYVITQVIDRKDTHCHQMILFPFGRANVNTKPCFWKQSKVVSCVLSEDIANVWDDVSEDTVYPCELPYRDPSYYDTLYQWVQCYATDEDIEMYGEEDLYYEHALYVKIPLLVRSDQVIFD